MSTLHSIVRTAVMATACCLGATGASHRFQPTGVFEDGVREVVTQLTAQLGPVYDVRVAKGRGDRGYDAVRVSVRSHTQLPPDAAIRLLGTSTAGGESGSWAATGLSATAGNETRIPFTYAWLDL